MTYSSTFDNTLYSEEPWYGAATHVATGHGHVVDGTVSWLWASVNRQVTVLHRCVSCSISIHKSAFNGNTQERSILWRFLTFIHPLKRSSKILFAVYAMYPDSHIHAAATRSWSRPQTPACTHIPDTSQLLQLTKKYQSFLNYGLLHYTNKMWPTLLYYTVHQENIPDLFSYNSQKHRRIFIIFGIHISKKSHGPTLMREKIKFKESHTTKRGARRGRRRVERVSK